VISTVDPQPRHGHKTSAHRFDGYKGHIAIDPDSEVITATTVTAGNAGDAASAGDLLAADLPASDVAGEDVAATDDHTTDRAGTEPAAGTSDSKGEGALEAPLAVYGDAAYGSGALLANLENAGADTMTKVQPRSHRGAGSPRTPSPSIWVLGP